jgi:hypothetical protein
MKPPCGGFRSENATWIQKWFKIPVGTSRKLYLEKFFKAETMDVGWLY